LGDSATLRWFVGNATSPIVRSRVHASDQIDRNCLLLRASSLALKKFDARLFQPQIAKNVHYRSLNYHWLVLFGDFQPRSQNEVATYRIVEVRWLARAFAPKCTPFDSGSPLPARIGLSSPSGEQRHLSLPLAARIQQYIPPKSCIQL
jgi:hypothetical protein